MFHPFLKNHNFLINYYLGENNAILFVMYFFSEKEILLNLIDGAYIFYQEVSLLAVSLWPPKESVMHVPWWWHPTENRDKNPNCHLLPF